MKELISAALLLLAGAALALVLLAIRDVWKNRVRRAAPRGPRHWPKMETTKLVMWFCLANGIAWVWFSYYLAWKEKSQIAEGLSQVAVTEIIGVVLAYCIKSAVENLSKNNRWPDKGGGPDDEGGAG